MFPHDARERRCSGGCVSRIPRSTPSAVRSFIPETQAPTLPPQKSVVRSHWSVIRAKAQHAFTLLELLIVIGIIAVLLVLLAPAFTTIKSGTDITSAAYTIKGALDTARTYAKANNTYTGSGLQVQLDRTHRIPSPAKSKSRSSLLRMAQIFGAPITLFLLPALLRSER